MIKDCVFDENTFFTKLKKHLPNQAPLKDFIHHNPLHSFQGIDFFEASYYVNKCLGYKTILSISNFRGLYKKGEISKDNLLKEISRQFPDKKSDEIFNQMVNTSEINLVNRKVSIRSSWIDSLKIDLESYVQLDLFRIINSYFDQGVSQINTGVFDSEKGLLENFKLLESNSAFHFIQSKRVKHLLNKEHLSLTNVLEELIGDERFYEIYIFEQQMSHAGWSGMVSITEETDSKSFYIRRKSSLNDFVILECLLELDWLIKLSGNENISFKSVIDESQLYEVNPFNKEENLFDKEFLYKIVFQKAYENTLYDQAFRALLVSEKSPDTDAKYQAFFCMDDRECSLRRNLENINTSIKTFGTPGHFNLAISFQAYNSVFASKSCPAPVKPLFLIKESECKITSTKDFHFNDKSNRFINGLILTHSIGIWSGLKLALNIFKPTENSSVVKSKNHMNQFSSLEIDYSGDSERIQIGMKLSDKVQAVKGVLESTGLIKDFSSLIYLFGHGSSSSNNTHYAGYDCGACSGRPGSVNARVFSQIANESEVREALKEFHIEIPSTTIFVGALHDTTADEVIYFDLEKLPKKHLESHQKFMKDMDQALLVNAKERSRRFTSIDSQKDLKYIHKKIKERTLAIFEPRPELNHSNNTFCIIGDRSISKNIFLDRRAFLNSYDYKIDSKGVLLEGIINAAVGVVGGINLEYYYSKIDNDNFGAGTKLSHNVMGLIAVANGVEGDLRFGLPRQMIEIHDPVRMMMIVEQDPILVNDVIRRNEKTFEWFKNHWVHLVCFFQNKFYRFSGELFELYQPVEADVVSIDSLEKYFESSPENLQISLFKH